MSRFHRAVSLLACLTGMSVTAAHAVITNPTPQRAYVSVHGLDTNNCGPTAPCRTFATALTQVNPDGEVLVLDSGGYGLMTITQGVTVTAPPGVYAGMSVFSGNGITVNAPGAKVVLRGLTVNGQGGSAGIVLTAAASLTIENCLVSNFPTSGFGSPPTGAGIYLGATATTHIIGSTVTGNHAGIWIDGSATVDISGSRAGDNFIGIIAYPTAASLTIATEVIDSEISGNSLGGVAQDLAVATGTVATLDVIRSSANHNGSYAIAVEGGTVNVSASTIAGNPGTGLANFSGTLNSAGNNTLLGNGTPTSGTITLVPGIATN